MAKSCSMLNTFGLVCGKIDQLNRCILIQEDKDSVEVRWLCQQHAKEFIENTIYDERNLKMMVDIQKHDAEEHRNLMLKPEIGYDQKAEVGYENISVRQKDKKQQDRQEGLQKRLNEIRWNTCRHELCSKTLNWNEYRSVLIIMSSKNKFRAAYYYHSECFRKIRAKLGITLPIHQGQFDLKQYV